MNGNSAWEFSQRIPMQNSKVKTQNKYTVDDGGN